MIILYRLIQMTWGFIQSFIGLILFILYIKEKHYAYHGAIITEWHHHSSVSLGLFIFIAKGPFLAFDNNNDLIKEKDNKRVLVHEYGHTIQSLILGPLYLFIIGISSVMWLYFKRNKRRMYRIPYASFYTEKWANVLGEYITKEKSIEDLILD